MKPLLSVIIVSYNTSSLTHAAISAVADDVAASSLLKDKTEIIVVDNHSTDETVDDLKALKKQIPYLQVLVQDHNLGFAQANNLAIEQSESEYVLLLNSDTLVQPGALEALVQTFLDHPDQPMTAVSAQHQGKVDRLGVVAATLLNPDKSIQPQGGSFPTLISLTNQMLMLDDIPVIGKWLPSTQHTGKNTRHHSQLFQQDWVGGTAMMIRRAVFAEIGMLDPNIFMYGEDVEFCLRAKQHHWDIAIQPQAQIIHFGTASTTSYFALKGELLGYLYIWSKHRPHWQVPIIKHVIRVGCLLRSLIFDTMAHDSKKAKIYRTLAKEIASV
jgi:N-acetylglucosaminyl-diphospho-decaprenol L-rhamnosyltransferase